MTIDKMNRTITKAAAQSMRAQLNEVEVVVFNERRPKVQKVETHQDVEDNQPQNQRKSDNEFNLKKARFEVTKLAMSSLKSYANKKEAKEALAISLGARPEKQRGINYRDLKAKRNAEKEAEEHEEKMRSLGKVLKRTGRKTATGKNMGSGAATEKSRKGTPKAPAKLKSGILGKYGKVDKGKLKFLKSQQAAAGKPGKPQFKKFNKSKK